MAFSIRLSEPERELATSYARLHSMSLGEAFKTALFERIEDEFDVAVGRDALREYEQSGRVSRPIDRLWDECGL